MNDEPKIRLWKCPNCGQGHFGDVPPDMCDFCQDFTTWRLVSGAQPEQEPLPPVESREETVDDKNHQLPLFPHDHELS